MTTRRQFAKNIAVATAGMVIAKPLLSFGNKNANDTINAAVVGVRSRGKAHIQSIKISPNFKLIYNCDVDG